jgi:hypothetical protein
LITKDEEEKEKMKKYKIFIVVLMIATMMSGSAWAWNASEHVKAAPNGKGDLLFFPYFFAYPGGYSTHITVINTSSTQSVVAKVIYRSWNYSSELRDHLIYLSPNDVWTADLVNVDGVARLRSTDDSILGKPVPAGAVAADDNFANISPVDIELVPAECAGDDNTEGYIEVIEAAARTESVTMTGYAPGSRVAKKHIYDWYESLNVDQPGSYYYLLNYPPVNVLTGYQQNTFGVGSTLSRANVFADYENQDKLEISAPTTLGLAARNNVPEIEAAMVKLNVGLPYVAKANGDSALHVFNFPTKQSSESPAAPCANYSDRSPYWSAVGSKYERYSRNIYDLSENTPSVSSPIFSPVTTNPTYMGAEVQFNFVEYSTANPSYTEGWIRYNWEQSSTRKVSRTQNGSEISYYGTPVLASGLYWTATRSNPAEALAAYDDGNVSIGSRLLPYYQYTEDQEAMPSL